MVSWKLEPTHVGCYIEFAKNRQSRAFCPHSSGNGRTDGKIAARTGSWPAQHGESHARNEEWLFCGRNRPHGVKVAPHGVKNARTKRQIARTEPESRARNGKSPTRSGNRPRGRENRRWGAKNARTEVNDGRTEPETPRTEMKITRTEMEARSENRPHGPGVGPQLGIGNSSFFSHSDLGIGHFPASGGSLKLFSAANVVFIKRAS